MTNRRPRIVGPTCLCLLIVTTMVATGGTASAATGGRPSQSRKHLILLLTHPSGGLASFVKAVSDPSSPQYRQFLPIGQLERQFGASPQTQQAVQRWLASHGLRGRIDPTGTFVDVSAPAADERTDFPMLAVSRLAKPASYRTADARRQVPTGLRGSVSAVIDGDVRLPKAADGSAVSTGSPLSVDALFPDPMGSSARGRTGTPSGCQAGQTAGPAVAESRGWAGFTPNQYLTAYGFDPLLSQIRSRGNERLALIELGGGFRQSDLNTFVKCFGIRRPNINVIALPHRQTPTGEATLDVEVAAAAAPNVKSIDVYEAPGTLGGVINLAAETLRLRNRQPNVESSSYGLCEPEFNGAVPLLKGINSILEFDAAAGITVLSAAGDTGSTDCSLKDNSAALPIQSVDYPGSSPYATSVGGLNMTLGKTNQLRTEQVWNNGPIAFGAGGGGASLLFTRPWYQSITGAAAQRSVPDVSMLADDIPGYAIYCTPPACQPTGLLTPGWDPIGGTSAATPLLAGGVADADQIAAAQGEPAIGFLNPLLYALGRRSGGGALRDVTVGNNDLGKLIDKSPTGCCSAHPGYDRASGLGSVNVAALARSADRAYRRAPRVSSPEPMPRGH
jgi:subtilase family serine protease